MPTAYIANIGPVEYISKELPYGVKGQSYIGGLFKPILITEDLAPGTKLDYVVAHEVGHRLTLDMISNAAEEMPEYFKSSRGKMSSALVKYFIFLGLKEEDVKPLHPGTTTKLHQIFQENLEGQWTKDADAQEFIAEVYANWATNTGHTPPAIAKRFQALTVSKNILLGKLPATTTTLQPAAFNVTDEGDYRKTVVFLLALGVLVAIFNGPDAS